MGPHARTRPVLIATLVAVLLGASLFGTGLHATPFTLDEVLDRPIPSDLTAARDVPRIAWVLNERGARNLWTAAAPSFEPRPLTEFEGDTGQPLSSLQLTPNGEVLVFGRGSELNASGEHANPDSNPAGVTDHGTWAVRTDGSGTPWRVATASGPVLSPNGTHVLFARGGAAFEVPIVQPTTEQGDSAEDETTPEHDPEPLFSSRGGTGALTYAPDGQRIAFVSGRGDHSFVGVFDRTTTRITWIAPSVDRDGAPVFSPDGAQLAFLRMPGARIDERFDLTGAHSFAIWLGDPATGEAYERWRSKGDDGGFAQFYPSTALAWAGTKRLVFTSEEGGWLHAWSLAVNDEAPAIDLTPGAREVEGFILSNDGDTVFFWGNHGDGQINRRHIWRVPAAGGKPVHVTTGDGIEADPTPLADGRTVALRFADARHPMAVGVVAASGGTPRVISPATWPRAFPNTRLVEPQAVTFDAADGVTVHGQLFLPSEPATEARPAVIFMHGGPIRQMLLGWHYSGYYANAYAFNQFLANRGYVVLSVNFRAGIGYGRAFRRAPDQGPRGASEYQDVQAAGRYLAARDDVDARRIGLWGGSYGGLLTAMGLARDSDQFAAGVDLHGVHDWAYRGRAFPLPGGAWGLGEDDEARAYAASPVADVEGWRSPVLFVHGDDDRNVLFIQTTDLVQRLRDQDVHVETLVFPDEVHGFLRHESWRRTFHTASEFFDRFLRQSPESQQPN